MITLDHLAVSAATLAEGVAAVEAALGVPLASGGAHEAMGTHNRLLGLGPGLYLEVIAIDPAAVSPRRPRWFNLDQFSGPPRLTNWIARTDDLEATLKGAPPGMGVPVSLARGPFSWAIAVPHDGRLPFDGAAPALIQWEGALHPADRLPDEGCRLHHLTVEHPDADALLAAFPALGGLDQVSLAVGEQCRLTAEIDTPGGRRILN